MVAVNYSRVRQNLKSYMDKASKDYETIIITRKDTTMSCCHLRKRSTILLENAYLTANKANLDWLEESKKQADNKQGTKHQLIEY